MGDIDGELRFEILQGMVKINWAPEDGTLILEDSDSEYENRPVSDSQAISSCDRKQVKVVEHHSLTASSVQNISREIQGAIPDMQENDAQQFGMHAKKHNGRKINDQKSNTVVEHMPVHDDIPDIDSEPDDMGPSTNSKSLSYPSSVVQSNVLIEDDLQRKQQTQEQCKPVALFTGLTDLHSRITVPFTPYCICYTPGTLPVGQRPTLVVHATDFQALYHSVMAGTFTDESSSFLSSSSSSSTIVSAGASKDYQGEDKQQDSLEHELEEKPTFLPVCEKKEVAHVRRLLSLTHVKYIPGGKHGVWTVEEMAKFRKKDVRKLLGDDFVDHHEPSVLGTGVEHLVKWWSARSKYFKVVPPILLAALFVGWMLGCTIYQYTVCLYPHEIRCESIPFASVPEPTTALDGNTSTTPTAVASISASEKPAAADAGAMVTTITSIALARPTSDVMVRDRYTEVGLFGRSTADLHKGRPHEEKSPTASQVTSTAAPILTPPERIAVTSSVQPLASKEILPTPVAQEGIPTVHGTDVPDAELTAIIPTSSVQVTEPATSINEDSPGAYPMIINVQTLQNLPSIALHRTHALYTALIARWNRGANKFRAAVWGWVDGIRNQSSERTSDDWKAKWGWAPWRKVSHGVSKKTMRERMEKFKNMMAENPRMWSDKMAMAFARARQRLAYV